MSTIIAIVITVLLLKLIFGVSFAILSALLWLFVRVPLAVLSACLGLICCLTVILIPLGFALFKIAGGLLFD